MWPYGELLRRFAPQVKLLLPQDIKKPGQCQVSQCGPSRCRVEPFGDLFEEGFHTFKEVGLNIKVCHSVDEPYTNY